MKRCVIVGGAPIGDGAYVRSALREDDYLICCDSGLKHLGLLGRQPDLIIGDFDSHPRPETDVETIVLPTVKDDTDTAYAVKEALRRGYEDFLLIGVVGKRLDHTWANVCLLLYLDDLGKRGVILDDYSEISVISRTGADVTDDYPFFSLLNITGTAEDITVENAKYNLRGAAIDCGFQYGVSNEVLPGAVAHITVGRGKLLLIKVRHE